MTPSRRSRRLLVAPVAVAALAWLGGCAVKAPPINRWTLGGSEDVGARFDAQGPSLGLATVTSAPEVRTTSLCWRSEGGRRLDRHPTEQWADYPDHLVEGLLLGSLARSGGFSLVRATPPSADLDWVLACELTDFTEWNGPGHGEGRVAMRCLLTPAGEDAKPVPLEAEGKVATPQATAAGMVEGIAAAARQAVDSLVSQVRETTAVAR